MLPQIYPYFCHWIKNRTLHLNKKRQIWNNCLKNLTFPTNHPNSSLAITFIRLSFNNRKKIWQRTCQRKIRTHPNLLRGATIGTFGPNGGEMKLDLGAKLSKDMPLKELSEVLEMIDNNIPKIYTNDLVDLNKIFVK